MRKQHLVFTALFGLLTFAVLPVSMAKAEAAQKLKVGVVDFQKAINMTKEGKGADAAFQRDVEERKKKFEILKKELEDMRIDLEKNRLVMDEKTLNDKKTKLQEKLMEVERTGMNYEQELTQKKGESLQKILTGLQGIVETIGKEDKYDFIFEKSQGGVLYTFGSVDLTDRVIKAYDQKAKP
ncbi:MAG: OmpH family outer membrane protein [Deltaproteobacteria bacterium]|nr:OmpH family outer membrane protein [Deltaproteobacteria bacterium]